MDIGIKKIACVIPTVRMKESMPAFMEAWQPLFYKHNVELVIIDDTGDKPIILHNHQRKELIENELISNKCAAVRQLGFLYVSQYLPDVKYIITLDDDEFPIGDPIQDHIDQLNRKVPISWISTASDYMRGFPYKVREEAPVMVSHGVWEGNYDWDAPSQLLKSNDTVEFYKGVIPKGIYFPMCGMNLAFSREALPYMYFAPVGKYKGAERFDDIWMGIEVINDFAKLNWGIVTGYAKVNHLRASNVFYNLEKEAVGIRKNEEYWQGIHDEWYIDFLDKRKKWYELTNEIHNS